MEKVTKKALDAHFLLFKIESFYQQTFSNTSGKGFGLRSKVNLCTILSHCIISGKEEEGLQLWGAALSTARGEDLWFLLECHFVVIPLQTRTHQHLPGQEV